MPHAKSALHRTERERLEGVAQLIGQVKTIANESCTRQDFDPAEWFARWIHEPSPALGGILPAELLKTADGREAVSCLLAQMQSGAYA